MLPETFSNELTRRLGRNYTLRRAIGAPRWCIEQKVGVGHVYDYPANDDRGYRLAHGLHLVLDTPDSDTTRCPTCNALLSLPVFERREFDCPRCKAQGIRKCSVIGGYFPLTEKTLLYLERTSPKRGNAFGVEMDAANKQWRAGLLAETRNLAEDLALEHYNQIAEIKQFAYNSQMGSQNTYGNYHDRVVQHGHDSDS